MSRQSLAVVTVLIAAISALQTTDAVGTCPFAELSVVRCPNDGGIFRIVNGKRKQFSPEAYAAQGYPAWKAVNCARLYKSCPPGANVALPKPKASQVPPPTGPCPFADDSVVRCEATGAIYRVANKIRTMLSPEQFQAAGGAYTQPGCALIATCSPPCPFAEGAVVRCEESGEIDRIEGGARRQFSPEAFAEAKYPAFTQPGCALIASCPAGEVIAADPKPSPSPSPSPSPEPGCVTGVGCAPPPTELTPVTNNGTLPPGANATLLGTSRTTYHYYSPGYQPSTTYCADRMADKDEAWLRAYPWVAYCNSAFLGGMSEANCGRCLRLTNLLTGAAQIVRIVDECGHNAIDSDWETAFKPIDTDRRGYLDGSLPVRLELVAGGGDC
eukprot:scaffold7.g3492.t1